ncbi:hypothetical protein D3C85_956310 [compost metagenome]
MRVLGGLHARDTDRAYQLASQHQRKPPLERACAVRGQQPEVDAARGQRILEHLGGTLESHGAFRLGLGNGDAPGLGLIHLVQQDQIGRAVHDGDHHRPAAGLSFGPGCRRNPLRGFERQGRAVWNDV